MAIRYLSGINVDSNTLFVDDANNRVGIGTASPAYKLDVAGDVNIPFGTSNGYRINGNRILSQGSGVFEFGALDYKSTYPNISTNSDGTFRIQSNGSTLVTVNQSGNVGIGTTSPYEALDIVGNIRIGNYTTAGTRYIGYANNTFGDQFIAGMSIESTALGGNYSQKLNFATHYYGVSAGVRMTIDEVGNVGIGTASPNARLTVVANDSSNPNVALRLSSTGYSGVSYPNTSIRFGSAYSSYPSWNLASIDAGYTGASWGGSLLFYTNNDSGETNLTERMRITAAGNVGIGTTSPADKLHVDGARSNFNGIRIGENSNLIQFPNEARIVWGNSSYLELVKGSTTALYINSSANVGIGTTSPSYKLDVAGTGYFSGGVTLASTLYVASTLSANSVVNINGGNELALYNSSNNASMQLFNNAGSGLSSLGVYDSAAAAYRMYINTSGNVGIGTASPGAKLDIVGTNSTLALSYGNTVPNNPLHTNYYGGYTGIGMDSATAGVRIVGDTNTLIMDAGYYTSGSPQHANWNSLLRVMTNGNVGIGTTSPAKILDINIPDASHANYGIRLNSAAGYGGASLYHDYGQGNGATVFKITNDYGDARINLTQDIYDASGSPSSIRFFTAPQGGGDTGLERVRIASTGNVGIGTTSPSTKLDVIGVGAFGTMTSSRGTYSNGLSLQNNTGEATSLFLWQSGVASAHIGSPANSTSLHIVNSYNTGLITDPNSIVLTNTGNVGIGTDAPTQKLHVSGSARVTGAYYDSSNSAGSSGQVLSSTGSGTDWVSLSEITGVDGTGTANYIAKWSDTDTITDSVIYDNGTNVGIGTTSPFSKLTVSGALTSSESQISIVNTEGGHAIIRSGIAGVSNNGISFITAAVDGTSQVNNMVIDAAGEVGIGTTQPMGPLEVYKANTQGLGGHIILNNNGLAVGNETAILFNDSGVGSASFVRAAISSTVEGSPYAGDIKFKTGVSAYASLSTQMIIKGNGNVGIGTTSPGAKLEVNGNILFSTKANSLVFGATGADGTWGAPLITRIGSQIIMSDYGGVQFGGYDGSAYGARMTVLGTGNVGIGTTSPTEILELSTTTDPKIRFVDVGNTDAKIGIVGSTALGFEVNGSERMRIASTGATRLNAYGSGSFTGTVAYNLAVDSSGNVIETAGGVVDGSGTANYVSKWSDANTLTNSLLYDNGSTISIGLGSITPSYTSAYGYPQFAIESNAFASSHVFTHNDTNGNYSFFALGKSKGTAAAPTIVENSETIGDFQFWAYDGAAYRNTAFIRNQIDGEPGAGDVPGRLVFGTTNDGSSAASEKMRITSAGNVGIGTTAPESKLHVVSGAGEAGFLSRGASGDTWFPYNNGQNYVRGVTNFDNAAVYFTGGNVGIGTTSPATKLHIKDSSAGTKLIIETTGTTGEGYSELGFTAGSSVGYIWLANNSATSWGGAGSLNIYTQGAMTFYAGGTEKMRITSAGNVGIGTTSPGERLHVSGSARINGTIYSGDGSISANNSLQLQYSAVSGDGTIAALSTGGNTTLALQTANSGTTATKLYLASGGSVRLNFYGSGNFTGTPTYNLAVDSSGNIIETAGGVVDGSGTANQLARWQDANTLTNAGIEDNGSAISIGRDAFYSSTNYGTAYAAVTGTSGGTAWFDTVTVAGARLYNITIFANPNINGSGTYKDFYYGKIIVGNGYNGSAVVDFINYHQESPQPRSLYGSGGGNLTVTAVFVYGGSEVTEVPQGATYTIRIKIAGYNGAGAGTQINLQRIM